MITREQWEQKSPDQQWVYLDALQRLYDGCIEVEYPPIDPTDTGTMGAINEIEGIDDSDRIGY